MEFPILTLMPLPQPAIQLVTQFLQPGQHPTAVLIKALTFNHQDAQEINVEDREPHIYACLYVAGPGVRIKDLSTPWPHKYVVRHQYTAYNPRWSAHDTIYSISFSYDEITGEQNLYPDDEDVESDDGDLVSNSYINSLSPWG